MLSKIIRLSLIFLLFSSCSYKYYCKPVGLVYSKSMPKYNSRISQDTTFYYLYSYKDYSILRVPTGHTFINNNLYQREFADKIYIFKNKGKKVFYVDSLNNVNGTMLDKDSIYNARLHNFYKPITRINVDSIILTSGSLINKKEIANGNSTVTSFTFKSKEKFTIMLDSMVFDYSNQFRFYNKFYPAKPFKKGDRILTSSKMYTSYQDSVKGSLPFVYETSTSIIEVNKKIIMDWIKAYKNAVD